MPNMEMIKDHLLKEGRLDETAVLTILYQAKQIMADETNIVYTNSPVTVVGDIHGQFYDLMTVFEKGKVFITSWCYLFFYIDLIQGVQLRRPIIYSSGTMLTEVVLVSRLLST